MVVYIFLDCVNEDSAIWLCINPAPIDALIASLIRVGSAISIEVPSTFDAPAKMKLHLLILVTNPSAIVLYPSKLI